MKKTTPRLSTREILQTPTFENVADIAEITRSYFNTMDLHFFGHAIVKPNGTFACLVSEHDWPHEVFAIKKAPPIGFTIYDQIQTRTFFPTMDQGDILGWPDEITRESKERFLIKNPMMLTKKHSDHYEIYIFDIHCKNPYEKYINHFNVFERFIHYYKDKSRKLIEKSKQSPLYVQPEYLPASSSLLTPLTDNSLCNRNREIFPQPRRYFLHYHNQEIAVSGKEYFCLSLLAHGKSLKRISVKLNVSLRTIETYIERLRKKFNLSTRDELIKVYWQNRFLSGEIHDIF